MAFIPSAQAILDKHLALYYFSSPNFQPWQLITYMFLHADFGHLFFNMFALFIFGRTIEMTIGSTRFLFYYMTCGICAALMQMGVFGYIIHGILGLINDPELSSYFIKYGNFNLYDVFDAQRVNAHATELISLYQYVNTPMVGASGAIYGVLLAFGFLYPNAPVFLFFIPIPIKAKWLIIGYFVLELVYGLSGSVDGVAHFAHLGGMIFGLLLLLYWKKKGIFNRHWFF